MSDEEKKAAPELDLNVWDETGDEITNAFKKIGMKSKAAMESLQKKHAEEKEALLNRITKLEDNKGILDRLDALEAKLVHKEVQNQPMKANGANYIFKIPDSFDPDSVKINYQLDGKPCVASVVNGKLAGPEINENSSVGLDGTITTAFNKNPDKPDVKISYKSRGALSEMMNATKKIPELVAVAVQTKVGAKFSPLETAINNMQQAADSVGAIWRQQAPTKPAPPK